MPPFPPPGAGTSRYSQSNPYQATWFCPGRSGRTKVCSRSPSRRRPSWRACSRSMFWKASAREGGRSVISWAADGRESVRAQRMRRLLIEGRVRRERKAGDQPEGYLARDGRAATDRGWATEPRSEERRVGKE